MPHTVKLIGSSEKPASKDKEKEKEKPIETVAKESLPKESVVKETTPPSEPIRFQYDKELLKKIKKVVVAFSHVEREWFPTEEAYHAEIEVEQRAADVVKHLIDMGIDAKGQPGNQYFLTNLLVDQPSIVINLVDTLKGKDRLQTSVPAALELSSFFYTGAGIEGLVIGNNRNLTKRLLVAYDIPTPKFQFIRRVGTEVQTDMGMPLIVKLNESGGSVGIDNLAVKETVKDAQKKVDDMISTYKMPVIVEQFIDGPEITVVVFDDGAKRHVLMGEKVFRKKPDGKHFFTSIESYDDPISYKYKEVGEPLKSKIEKMAIRAYFGLGHKDYAKFDIRVDESSNTPYITDSNPNTAFGPDLGLPFTEVLSMYGISFDDALMSLLSKYAKNLA
jgi:D-alanine-D-alanine ligase